MISLKTKYLAVVGGVLLSATAVLAQDSGPLLDALVRKGILTNQEAEDLRADLIRDQNTIPAKAIGGGKSTDRLSVGMRMQVQYASLDTAIKNTPVGPVATDHAFLRRMYITFKAGVGGNWGATMTYDLAGGRYDDAIIEWKPTPDLSFNFGLRKVNVAAEERGSSGDIRAIERSSVTRYFVESNNGRRIGAASYRIGAFLDEKRNSARPTALFTARRSPTQSAMSPLPVPLRRATTRPIARLCGPTSVSRVNWPTTAHGSPVSARVICPTKAASARRISARVSTSASIRSTPM